MYIAGMLSLYKVAPSGERR